jgi:hypothetical protein
VMKRSVKSGRNRKPGIINLQLHQEKGNGPI